MDTSRFRRFEDFHGEDQLDTDFCRELLDRAKTYIESFDWCGSVTETYVGDCVGGIVALVLFHVEPAVEGVDEWMWVVVGDLPPAYLAPASAEPRDALSDYIDRMSEWVQAVRDGRSTEELIPVNVSPTLEWADALDRRLEFLKREVLPTVGNPPG